MWGFRVRPLIRYIGILWERIGSIGLPRPTHHWPGLICGSYHFPDVYLYPTNPKLNPKYNLDARVGHLHFSHSPTMGILYDAPPAPWWGICHLLKIKCQMPRKEGEGGGGGKVKMSRLEIDRAIND